MLTIPQKVRQVLANPLLYRKARVKSKALLLGSNSDNKGLLRLVVLYAVLIDVSLIYLAPIISMLGTSLKTFSDLIDPTTRWIPKHFVYNNYVLAFKAMKLTFHHKEGFSLWDNLRGSAFFNTLSMSLPSAVVQVFSCAIAGYAFGRMKFPGKNLFFFILILTFVIPPQTLMIPLIWTYKSWNLLDSPFAFIGPALFGHGVRGALFVFIYMQFFRKLPKELEEAAIIDGVGAFQMFRKVMFPLAKPAIIVVFLFSLVFHWNETMLTQYFYIRFTTLPKAVNGLQPDGDPSLLFVQPIKMAAGVLEIAPLLIIYFFTQKWFTESIERTGLVE